MRVAIVLVPRLSDGLPGKDRATVPEVQRSAEDIAGIGSDALHIAGSAKPRNPLHFDPTEVSRGIVCQAGEVPKILYNTLRTTQNTLRCTTNYLKHSKIRL